MRAALNREGEKKVPKEKTPTERERERKRERRRRLRPVPARRESERGRATLTLDNPPLRAVLGLSSTELRQSSMPISRTRPPRVSRSLVDVGNIRKRRSAKSRSPSRDFRILQGSDSESLGHLGSEAKRTLPCRFLPSLVCTESRRFRFPDEIPAEMD